MNKNSDGTTGIQGNNMTKVEHKVMHARVRAYSFASYYSKLQQRLKVCPQNCCVEAPIKLRNHLNKLQSTVFNVVSGDYDTWVELK